MTITARDTSHIDWHEYFTYDETSPTCLRWRVTLIKKDGKDHHTAKKGNIAGKRAGSLSLVVLKYVGYLTHRAVWEMHNGALGVDDLVDHINRENTDNRICNLRVLDRKTGPLNQRNVTKHSTNMSGVTGVCKLTSITDGKSYEYWIAHWHNRAGKQVMKRFSLKKYSSDEAFKLACEYRTKMIAELNAQGAGYTEDHGM